MATRTRIKTAEKVEVKNQETEPLVMDTITVENEYPADIQVAVSNERPLPPATIDPQALISIGLEKGTSIDTMERLFLMRKDLKAEAAREEFYNDFALFQNECPIITKNKKAGKESFNYEFATLDTIVYNVKPSLVKYGFSYTFRTEGSDMLCEVHHKGGHTETARFPITIDSSGRMNAIQKIGSARSYAKRYALCDALGIATADFDDDAQSMNDENQTTTTPNTTAQKVKTNIPVTHVPQVAKTNVTPVATESEPEEYEVILEAFFKANNTNKEQREAILIAVATKKDPVKKMDLIKAIIDKTEAMNTLDTLIDSLNPAIWSEWKEEKERCKKTEDYRRVIEMLRDLIHNDPTARAGAINQTIPLPGQKPKVAPPKNTIYKQDDGEELDLLHY